MNQEGADQSVRRPQTPMRKRVTTHIGEDHLRLCLEHSIRCPDAAEHDYDQSDRRLVISHPWDISSQHRAAADNRRVMARRLRSTATQPAADFGPLVNTIIIVSTDSSRTLRMSCQILSLIPITVSTIPSCRYHTRLLSYHEQLLLSCFRQIAS